jgi:hypothetical protein
VLPPKLSILGLCFPCLKLIFRGYPFWIMFGLLAVLIHLICRFPQSFQINLRSFKWSMTASFQMFTYSPFIFICPFFIQCYIMSSQISIFK